MVSLINDEQKVLIKKNTNKYNDGDFDSEDFDSEKMILFEFDNDIIVTEKMISDPNFKSCIVNDLYLAGKWYGSKVELNFNISPNLAPINIQAMKFSGKHYVYIAEDNTCIFKIRCQNTYYMYVKFNKTHVTPIDEIDFRNLRGAIEYELERVILPYFNVKTDDIEMQEYLKEYLPLCCTPTNRNDEFYMTSIKQQCQIEATHLGFQARALTKVVMLCGCGQPQKKPKLTEIIVDAPFSFAILNDIELNLISGIIGIDSYGLVKL
jgi:hypothetical protein